MGWVYLIESNGCYKIGITGGRIKDRMGMYKTHNPFCKLVIAAELDDYQDFEERCLYQFREKIFSGKEWFELDEEEVRCFIVGLISKKVYQENTISVYYEGMKVIIHKDDISEYIDEEVFYTQDGFKSANSFTRDISVIGVALRLQDIFNDEEIKFPIKKVRYSDLFNRDRRC